MMAYVDENENLTMTGWFGFIGTGGSYESTRYSAPASYILTNLPAGTYSFLLQMSREAEVGPISGFKIWGIAGTGQVFAR